MRLHVAERPTRRQLGQSGDARVLAHDDDGILRCDDEEIEGGPGRRRKPRVAVATGEVERALRMMDEQAPAVRTDEPLNRHARPMRRELISTLAVSHPIDLPF